jgi:hypothetical protein
MSAQLQGLALSYLNPPPMPQPVIVMKDVGGIVKDYQAQTELYRRTGREVRLHECRSACTLALSLPNVCVYPDSVVKFHQAYNLLSRATDFGVTEELFATYPTSVRARLGTLTRNYKVLSGSELIALGIRNCNEPRTMLAGKTPPAGTSSASQTAPASQGLAGALSGTWTNVMAALTPAQAGASNPQPGEVRRVTVASPPRSESENLASDVSNVPLPPPRPTLEDEAAVSYVAASNDMPLPPLRPEAEAEGSYTRPAGLIGLRRAIPGAQPVLPARFVDPVEVALTDSGSR